MHYYLYKLRFKSKLIEYIPHLLCQKAYILEIITVISHILSVNLSRFNVGT